jgi:ABC-type branched-subunit amino acid transport system substrate-binding protein
MNGPRRRERFGIKDRSRGRWRRLAAAAILLVALPVLIAACGDDDSGGGSAGSEPAGEQAQLDLVVGDLIPLSGDLADFGPPARKAADLAQDQIESAIEQAGAQHTIEVLHEDTQTQPQAAVAAARSVVGQDASCISGPFSTAETIPVARSVAIRDQVLQITPGSTSDDTTKVEDDGYLNRTILPNRIQGRALADLVEQELGGADGTINVGARNDAYGTGLADTFEAAWEEKGGKVGAKVVYDPEQTSYNSEAQEIAAGDPDGWVILDFPETFGIVAPALVRTGSWEPSRTFVAEGLMSSTLPEDVGSEGTEGIRGTTPGSPDEGSAATAFDRLYKQAPGPRNRQSSDSQTFDAIVLCYLSAVAAGSVEGADMTEQLRAVSAPPGRKLTFEQLPEAIEALENGEDIDYEGAAGSIDLDEAGDPTAGVYDLFRYRGGKIYTYGEVPVGG